MFAILIPVYHDGAALARLIREVDAQHAAQPFPLDVVIVNDGGPPCAPFIERPANLRRVIELTLAINLGHQRAIAVGLCHLATAESYQAVIIMDGDGEDKPADVFRLLDCHRQHPQAAIVAQRTARSEGLSFRLFYRLYKGIFALLTGKRIDFGNFMLLPAEIAARLTYDANLWNHLAAAVLASDVALVRLQTSRGQRYQGRSRMSFERLVIHGLSAMSVYLTQIFTRIMVGLGALLAAALAAIGVVVIIRYFTDLAIPGWATNLTGILLIIILQLILLMLVSAFALLNQRATLSGIPLLHLQNYIKHKHIIY